LLLLSSALSRVVFMSHNRPGVDEVHHIHFTVTLSLVYPSARFNTTPFDLVFALC
jgi:hypothetical protein